MAELAKKLHFKKGATEHLAKAYSTTAEAGTEYITNKIDGVTAYIPIGATNDSRATMGRVTKNGTKSILTMGKPPYTEKSWTTPGTYTFTVPAGVTRIRVAVCGGGGGGSYDGDAEDGGISKFGNLIQATGGQGSYLEGDYWNGTEDNSNGTQYNGKGGSPNGRNGYFSGYAAYGGKGFALRFNLADGTYGNGGTGNAAADYNGGGGSGGYNSGYVNVTPGSTYSISVGSGGAYYYYMGPSSEVTSGTSGFVLIAYGGDI